jgi:hypothetical protein
MEPAVEFLTVEECAQVDAALLTARDKFTARVAIYALRSLKQIAAQSGQTVAHLDPGAITTWIATDPSLQDRIDSNFRSFFERLVMASLKPLNQAATQQGLPIESLSVPQVIGWFEEEAKRNLELGTDRASP